MTVSLTSAPRTLRIRRHFASTLSVLFMWSVTYPMVLASSDYDDNITAKTDPDMESTKGLLLAANKRKSPPPRRSPKGYSNTAESNNSSRDTAASTRGNTRGLAAQTTGRGLIGFFMGENSAMIFGAGMTLPRSKTMALDGGLDYVKVGSEYVSVSMLRFAGGGSYIFSTNQNSTFRFGGRLGIARVTVSYTLPAIFEGDEAVTESASSSSLYGELRSAYEIKMGSLVVGGEVQIPIFYADKTSGTEGLAIYASLGTTF
jgi:hypothetical protein